MKQTENIIRYSLICFQAAEIADVAYSVDWIGTPISFQRSILIIITMAQQEFYLTAGKFVPVSRKTMMNVRHDLIF